MTQAPLLSRHPGGDTAVAGYGRRVPADVHLRHSRSFPAGVARAFDEVLPGDLTRLFDRRYGAIPRIVGIRDQSGTWGTPGQTRTILLAGGGSMRETMLEVHRPEHFRYRIGEITGPMRVLATSLEGRWHFERAGTGVRITWSWVLQPAGPVGGAAMPAFRRMWHGYVRQGFDNIERLLVP